MGINAAGVAKASPSAWSTQSITLNANLAPGIFQGAFPAPCTPNPTKCSLARATSRWDFPAGIFQQGHSCLKFLYQIEFPIKPPPSWNSYSSSAPTSQHAAPLPVHLGLKSCCTTPKKCQMDSWEAAGAAWSRTRQRELQNSRSLRVFRRGSCTQETWEQSFVSMVHLSLGISRCQNSRRHQRWLN